MKIFTKLSYLFILSICAFQVNAQISFSDQTALLNGTNYSGVAIAVIDMNGDMLDDIVQLDNGNLLKIQYQTSGGGMFTEYYHGSVSSQKQWMLTAADCNNNGMTDLMCGDYGHSRYITADGSGSTFSATEFPGDDFFAQGANFADINNDGFLDAFICNDDGESFIYQNDGNGGFLEANDWIDMSINGSSGEAASGNYGSVWTDFDNDGDLDLYIAKCRQNVSSPTDERRINKLFVNDGNNNFTENAEEYGLRIGWQSWTADFNDIDNDGDFDCFITNHDYESQLLENDGTGHFTDITASSGVNVQGTAIQGLMRDFDNDGWMDILVSGSVDHLYLNNGDKTFTEIEDLFDDNNIESYGLGDLNNDGFVDIYAGYANLFNTPSNIPDALWMNEGNNNNWFTVNLEGTTSNRDGVGARIEIYGDWGMQVREVRTGESYGISNSTKGYFGLGQSTAVSHVIVKWPSGIVDVVENPGINQCVEIVEGNCVAGTIEVDYAGTPVICSGETFTITAPEGLSYYWSNGENTQEINVTEAGNYSVVVGNANGCYDQSDVVTLVVDPDETPSVDFASELVFCEGGSVTLTASEANSYSWSNGMTSQSIEVSESGDYTVAVEGQCGTFTSEAVTVTAVPYADEPVADDVELDTPGEATLEATGYYLTWYDAPVDGNVLGNGPTLTIPFVDMPTTYYVDNANVDVYFHGPTQHQGNSQYSGNEYNGDIFFDVYTDFKLKSVKVFTDLAGIRIVEVLDNDGNVIANKTVDIPEGESRVDLGFVIPQGDGYKITTNTDSNLAQFGYESPRLQRSSGGVNYPYVLDNIVSLTGGTLGASRYYYFYDWEVQTPPVDCESDRVPVTVSFTTGAIDITKSDAVNVFPNPTSGQINIELNMNASDVSVLITNITGQQLVSKQLGAVSGDRVEDMDLSNLAAGSYLLCVVADEEVYFSKLIVE